MSDHYCILGRYKVLAITMGGEDSIALHTTKGMSLNLFPQVFPLAVFYMESTCNALEEDSDCFCTVLLLWCWFQSYK